MELHLVDIPVAGILNDEYLQCADHFRRLTLELRKVPFFAAKQNA